MSVCVYVYVCTVYFGVQSDLHVFKGPDTQKNLRYCGFIFRIFLVVVFLEMEPSCLGRVLIALQWPLGGGDFVGQYGLEEGRDWVESSGVLLPSL